MGRKEGKVCLLYPVFRWSLVGQVTLTAGALTVDLATLSTQQLSSVKKQLDDEISHLTQSYTSLRQAQAKFKDCLSSIVAGISSSTVDKPLLVPLTSSLYVPGTLADTEKVVVDVGTGFYVEKSCADAKVFYESKVEELGRNIGDLEKIVQGKAQNVRLVEEGECECILLDKTMPCVATNPS